MRRTFVACVLSIVTALSSMPVASARAIAAGTVSGAAMNTDGVSLAFQTAQVRNLESRLVAGSSKTDGLGHFTFSGLEPGIYVVELLEAGSVVGTSGAVVLSKERMMVAGVEARAQTGQPAAISGNFWTSTLGIVVASAAIAGVVAAVVITKNDASPSR